MTALKVDKVVVYGLGALGSNLLVQLVRQFPQLKYEGVDYDKVEDRNIRIQAFFLEHVGALKAPALRTVLLRYVRKVDYNAVVKKVTEQVRLPDERTLVLDCFDNSASRKLVKGHPNILHLGFSPFYTAELVWDPDYDVPGDVDPNATDICQLQDAALFIHSFVNRAALEISSFIQDGTKKSFIVTSKSNVKML